MPAPSDLMLPNSVASSAEASAKSERRESYRLHFPYPERPRLLIGSCDYEVVDCSTHGVRYIITPSPSLRLGDCIQGTLKFRRQPQIPIRGSIVRIQNREIALYLPDSEIPFAVLWNQERYLLMHYPMRKR
ncbi:MAG: PilZ domain-containing protein [Candidatus Competibacter sp.]|nr:PilZ domain-containing protein [Candidatus Competibacter sp.]